MFFVEAVFFNHTKNVNILASRVVFNQQCYVFSNVMEIKCN